MRQPTIARNYAQALFEVGERSGVTERFADLMSALAAVILAEAEIRAMLASPRVTKGEKQRILGNALEGIAPEGFIRFLHAVIKRGRQGLLPAIGEQYLALVDKKFNRVHVSITVAREPSDGLRAVISERLSRALRREIIPHYRTDGEILGGVILRVGDRIMDGSVRRRMKTLRRQMLGGR